MNVKNSCSCITLYLNEVTFCSILLECLYQIYILNYKIYLV